MIKLPEYITRNVVIALVLGGFSGVGLVLFLIEFDHLTSTEAFCTSCHSMELVAEPYRKSSHYLPDSGVRAHCGHCHVSEGVIAATLDHIVGAGDLFNQLFGADYDDPAVNALHLPEMAFRARAWFRETDSATCRRCHDQGAIMGERPDTWQIHQEDARGKTCIDCHQNLVHRKVPSEKTFKRDAWNRMIEEEFQLPQGSADAIMAR
ncbi:MAG: NapC/NirT family cytochrome c [Candidatus Sedimenticola endophacoides]|uniref:Cytochrome C n=1 Tax=Candidatus Sedimenticola endophacoides TaxID=2548426 RepID=A0A657Q7D5_9GAMM|nr:MAG: cytochrome C [Candidatus Sedimenticola endophacoides]OQX37913.1 MAG: cytochrome C [Candidatus Sedimenticola endophacoides]OQX39006.1 MAG: cytochrome C [Candidatus Sedimenticola endophacoides]OQX42546.1 MAG: cytochrome C [Candidatus Sedimenticola endophacoides]OQX45683.1 MAG: cytochrome C [Candidatus Sedimenticola endophacoides]